MRLQELSMNKELKGLCIVYSNFFKENLEDIVVGIKNIKNKDNYLKERYEKSLTTKEEYELYLEKEKMKDYLKSYNIKGIIFSLEIEGDLNSTKEIPFEYLFYRGNINLMFEKNIAIVGSRKTTDYMEKATKKIINSYIKDNYNIISGLAKGTDTIALTECVDKNYSSIAVLPTPFSKISPVNNKELLENIINNKGLVLTEYYDIHKIYKNNFLKRNKIINFFSVSTLATEFGIKSGTKSQIKNAMEKNKIISTFEPNFNTSLENYIISYKELIKNKKVFILKDKESIIKYLEEIKNFK